MPAQPGADRGPSPLLPLAYLVCAAGAFLAAALGVVWLAPELAGHYYHPRILALTHAVTLGWVTLAIMGASYQLVPVVLERPVWSERLARWQLGVLAVAVTGMVAHFYLGTWRGLAAAAGLLAVGVAMHLVNVALSLRGLAGWTFTARLVALGYGGLAATTVFGLALAADRLWLVLPGGVFPRLHAHVQLALLGWVAPMILGVTARVYPMFFLAPAPRHGLTLVQLWGLAAAVPAIVAGLLGVPGLLPIGAVAATAALAAHAWWMIEMARARKRPGLDWGLRFALTATMFLVPGVSLGLALATGRLSGPRAALTFAVVVLGGWISLTIAGMMLKIVPFLVWYRVYGPRAGREPVPALAQLASPRLEGAAYVLLVGGAALLALAVFAGEPAWIRGAGAVFALGALAFTAALARILGHLTARVPGAASTHGRDPTRSRPPAARERFPAAGGRPAREMSAAPFAQQPFIAIWETTRACALACVHCRAAAMPRRDRGELTTEEGMALLDRIAAFGSPRPLVVFTGGDPLRRPDIAALVSHGHQRGLVVSLTPSGTAAATEDRLRALGAAGLARLAVSLDAAGASAHDAFRRVRGSHARTLRIIDRARALGLALQINTTVCRPTVGDLPALADQVAGFGAVLWALFFLIPVGRAQADQGLHADEIERVLHWAADLAPRVPFGVKTTEAPQYHRVLGERRARGASSPPGAVAALRAPRAVTDGNGFVFVDHVGNICPSGFLPLPAGNVRTDDLVATYREHPLFVALRDPERLGGRCGRCEWREACGGSRARAYAAAGDPLGEDPGCPYWPGRRSAA